MNLSISSPYTDDELIQAILEERRNKVGEIIGSVNISNLTSDCSALFLFASSYLSDKECRPPIHFAVQSRNEKITKFLLNKGADCNSKHIFGISALHIALKNRDEKFVTILLDYNADVNIKDNSNVTPLYLAAENKYFDIAKLLLNKGADSNATQIDGISPLHLVSGNGDEKLAKLLLNFNADVNSVDRFNHAPIHFAARYGYENIVKLLIDKRADIDVKDLEGKTALHMAAENGYEKITEILLKYNADPNLKCKKGLTPLLHAIKKKMKNVVIVLLEYDADVNITDTDENSLLDIVPNYQNYNYGSREYKLFLIIAEIIKDHLIKLHVAGLYLSEKNMQSSSGSQSSYQNKCKNEIEKMKSKKISDTNVSFYDILIKPRSKVTAFSRNNEILQVMNSNDYKTEFSIYASLINLKFKKAIQRGKLEGQLYQHFRCFLNFSKLPQECIIKVFDYLMDEELKILIDANFVEM